MVTFISGKIKSMTFNSYHHQDHLYFVTASICGFAPIFNSPDIAKIVLDSLAWLSDQKIIALYAFAIMPNHTHFIIQPINKTIGHTLQQFGSYTAHEILNYLQEIRQDKILSLFSSERRDQHRKYSVWQDIQAKNIYTKEVLYQKMEYIHNNPIQPKWALVKIRTDYPYSSACYYDRGEKPVIPVSDVSELFR